MNNQTFPQRVTFEEKEVKKERTNVPWNWLRWSFVAAAVVWLGIAIFIPVNESVDLFGLISLPMFIVVLGGLLGLLGFALIYIKTLQKQQKRQHQSR